MQTINRLGLTIALISAVAVILIGSIVVGVRALLNRSEEAMPSPTPTLLPPEQLLNAVDQDHDGLVDEIEPIYRTNPAQADTDQDGTNDGEEITLLRDPIVAGPDDTVTALTEGTTADPNTYTSRYLATLPADISRTEILQQDRLEAFIAAEGELVIPNVPATNVTVTTAAGEEAISAYLNSVSATHNPNLKAISSNDITNAFITYGQGQPQTLTTIVQNLESNVAILQEASVPAEALALHQKLLGASQALLTNVRLLANMKEDFIGGLIGAKNVEALGPVFNDIAQQISALETKYGLE